MGKNDFSLFFFFFAPPSLALRATDPFAGRRHSSLWFFLFPGPVRHVICGRGSILCAWRTQTSSRGRPQTTRQYARAAAVDARAHTHKHTRQPPRPFYRSRQPSPPPPPPFPLSSPRAINGPTGRCLTATSPRARSRFPVPIHRHRHVGPSRRLGLAAFMFR